MKPLTKKSKPEQLSRREIIAKRRQAVADSSSGTPAGGFRANQTISRSKERQNDSERQTWHDLQVKRKKLFAWLIGVVLTASALLILLIQLIATITVQTSSPIPSDDALSYANLLSEYLEERPLERLRFLVHQDSLEQYFAINAPEVASVKIVGTPNLATAGLQLAFRKPVAEWSSTDTTYFVDGSGVTFERNYFGSPAISVKDDSNLQIEAGQEVLDHRFLSFLGNAVSHFDEIGLEVQGVLLPDGMLRQLDIRLKDKPYSIRMTIDRDAEAQVGEAMYAINYMGEKGLAPQYIDVRVDRRVFYK